MGWKPIVCLDFDGVIHGYQSGWKGAAVIPDAPVPGAMDAITEYLDAGFAVHIFSSRSKSILGRIAMKRWLAKNLGKHWEEGSRSPSYAEAECLGDAEELVRRLKFPWFKPAATITIDDRAMQFTGSWPTAETIKAFKPWKCPPPVCTPPSSTPPTKSK